MVLPGLRESSGGVTSAYPARGKIDGKKSERSEMLRTYWYAMNFLLRFCATNMVIAETYKDVVNFCQSCAMTDDTYSRMLWDRSLLLRNLVFRQSAEVPLHRQTTSRNAATYPSIPFSWSPVELPHGRSTGPAPSPQCSGHKKTISDITCSQKQYGARTPLRNRNVVSRDFKR